MDYKIVYKMSIALKLIQKGHKVLSVMPNPNNPKMNCWVFEKTDAMMADFESFKQKRE